MRRRDARRSPGALARLIESTAINHEDRRCKLLMRHGSAAASR
ncbi:hypothetical protein BPC006_I2453 [Burkholderia pseudomallei BPC006]|nr:hypothetical protein BPC006_I2453 [Burkholderia pseudomallei BPC006]EDO92570.1 hypothetical protein BURPSPAST_AA1091 [Burkholderia pseudomallei Pasteur 52237]